MNNLDPYRPPTAPLDNPQQLAVAACPKCGAASASKVSYNWWGGALGPKLFHVVKCNQCKSQYNGRTGGKLTTVIIVYQLVILVVVLGLFVAFRLR
ncbi:MAG TPA: hypothetical protein VEQ58_17040 [Polyangiaceae bacterium]|nr:hypothetical protein [Polyangiaceae bacterium]